jgi:hypothetical protein
MYGPRFVTPGAGQIFKEQMHAPSIHAWLNLLQRALYPHNTQRILPPFARGLNLRHKSMLATRQKCQAEYRLKPQADVKDRRINNCRIVAFRSAKVALLSGCEWRHLFLRQS